jgi:hypothetical protein
MRISQKDKIMIYKYSLCGVKDHLENLIEDSDFDLEYGKEIDREDTKEMLKLCLTELKSVYKFMHKLYLEIGDKLEVEEEDYIYWDRVMK